MTCHEGMNEEPGEANGDEHGEEDEGEHETPGGAGMNGAGCLRWGIFVGIGHCLVYGDGLPQREGETKRVRAGAEISGVGDG